MSRDFDPVPGQWYEDLDQEEVFKVVSLDPDDMLVRIQWLDGEYEDLDLEAWNELDLEQAEEPEGWVDDAEDLDEEDEDEEDLDEDWDDEDEDDDDEEGLDPDEDEGVVLGRFVPFADTEDERRVLARALAREQRRMRLLEVDAEDLGVFDTWMRAAVEDGGSQIPKPEAPFQAEKYTIDARVRMSPPSIEGTAVLEVTARRAGCRILDLALGSSVRLQWVADASGRTLPFLRWSNRVAVVARSQVIWRLASCRVAAMPASRKAARSIAPSR